MGRQERLPPNLASARWLTLRGVDAAQGHQASCKVGCGRQRPHLPRPLPLPSGLSTPRASPQPLCSGATSLYPAGWLCQECLAGPARLASSPSGGCPSPGPGAEETHWVGNQRDKRSNSVRKGRRTQPCPAAPKACTEDPHPAPAARSQEPRASPGGHTFGGHSLVQQAVVLLVGQARRQATDEQGDAGRHGLALGHVEACLAHLPQGRLQGWGGAECGGAQCQAPPHASRRGPGETPGRTAAGSSFHPSESSGSVLKTPPSRNR